MCQLLWCCACTSSLLCAPVCSTLYSGEPSSSAFQGTSRGVNTCEPGFDSEWGGLILPSWSGPTLFVHVMMMKKLITDCPHCKYRYWPCWVCSCVTVTAGYGFPVALDWQLHWHNPIPTLFSAASDLLPLSLPLIEFLINVWLLSLSRK